MVLAPFKVARALLVCRFIAVILQAASLTFSLMAEDFAISSLLYASDLYCIELH
jgi:hypothetical protein